MLRAIARLNKAILKRRGEKAPRVERLCSAERLLFVLGTQQAEEVSLQAAFIYKVPRMRLEFVFTLAQSG